MIDAEPGQLIHLLGRAESAGLLTKREGGDERYRFHPLVLDFLQARANADLGATQVERLHLRVAASFEGRDWYLAATHFLLAGELERTWQVVNASVDQILARGAYEAAARLLWVFPDRRSTTTEVLRSRLLLQRGDFSGAREAAVAAVHFADDGEPLQLASALLNASSIHSLVGDDAPGRMFADRAKHVAVSRHQELMARALVGLLETTHSGSIPAYMDTLSEMRSIETTQQDFHHLAITNLNMAICANWLNRPAKALELSNEALMQFDASSRGYEAVSAHLAAAVALCQLARYDDAEEEIRVAVSQRRRPGLAEALATAAEIELWYGDPVRARDYLDEYERNEVGHSHRQLFLMARLWLALFTDDSSRIGAWTVELGDDPGGHANTGGRFSVALTKTRVRTRLGVVTADDFKALRAIADAQDSPLEHELVDMASAIWQGPASLSDVLERQKSGLSLSILADDVSRLLLR